MGDKLPVVNFLFTKMELFSNNLEGKVLSLLFGGGSFSTHDIIKRIRLYRPNATKQGIYRVLRKLAEEEKIVIYKSIVSLNNLWLTRLQLLLAQSGNQPSIIGDLRYLKIGEKISLHVKSLVHLDQVWSHIFRSIEVIVDKRHPLYLFNPHNWFILLREETDRFQMQTLIRKKRRVFLTVGNDTALDKETIRLVAEEKLESAINTRLRYPNYIAVLDDYFMQVKLASQGSYLIHQVFTKEVSPEKARQALARLNKKIPANIMIERNPAKARQWKKKLSHSFLVPREMRDF